MLLDFDQGIKLVDFGLSNTFSRHNEKLKTACGSPCYAAPEMISGKRYSPQVDVWSCGVVLFALLAGYLPFEDPDTGKLYEKILSAEYELPEHVSAEASDLISKIF